MKLAAIIEKMREVFVTKDVFELRLKAIEDEITPIQRIVYGFIVLILTAVGSYFVSLVIKKP